jgi:multiple sugar transport system substrate-binding protein
MQSTQYAQMNELIPLDSIIEEWRNEGKLDDFIQGSVDLHYWDTYQAGIPWIIDPRVFYVRQSALDEAGITEIPETFEEFVSTCIKIKDKTDYIPAAFPSLRVQMHYMFFCNDGSFVDENGNLALNDKRNVETLEKFFGALYDAGCFPENAAGLKYEDLVPLFDDNKLAIMLMHVQTSNEDVRNDITVWGPPVGPSNSTKTPRLMAWENPMVGYKQSKHPEEVKIFIKWWIENEMQLFKEGGSTAYPIFKSLQQDSFFMDDHVHSQAINEMVQKAVTPCWPSPYLWSPQFDLMSGAAIDDNIFNEILLGNKDYEGILNKYQKEMEVFWNENPDMWWNK